jgi:predicted secreted protein
LVIEEPGDATDVLRLQPGDEHELRLPGKGTVGYSWVVEIEGDPAVLDVAIAGASADEIAHQPAGVSVDELATLRARKPGTVTLRLVQRRSWDPSKVLDRRDLRVEVG